MSTPAPPTETVIEPTEQTPTETPAATETAPPVDLAAELEKWKAMSRQNEARAKENADKAKRLDQLEEASKTEAQKNAEALERLSKENEALRLDTLRANIAASKGVPVELLSGTTQEELAASADAALAWHGRNTTAAAPADKQGLGGKSATGPSQLTDADLQSMTFEQINAARREGRLKDVLGASN